MKITFTYYYAVAVFAFLAAFIACPAYAQSSPSIVIVDVQKLMNDSKAADSIQKQLKTRREALEKEFSKYENQLRDNEKELAEQRASGNQEAFAKKRDEFEKNLLETRGLVQKKKRALEEAVLKASEELRRNILQITAEIAEANSYDIVLTRQNVVIASKDLNITKDVMAKLNDSLTSIKIDVKE